MSHVDINKSYVNIIMLHIDIVGGKTMPPYVTESETSLVACKTVPLQKNGLSTKKISGELQFCSYVERCTQRKNRWFIGTIDDIFFH